MENAYVKKSTVFWRAQLAGPVPSPPLRHARATPLKVRTGSTVPAGPTGHRRRQETLNTRNIGNT